MFPFLLFFFLSFFVVFFSLVDNVSAIKWAVKVLGGNHIQEHDVCSECRYDPLVFISGQTFAIDLLLLLPCGAYSC